MPTIFQPEVGRTDLKPRVVLYWQAFLFLQTQRKEVIDQAVVEARHAILEAMTALASNDASLLLQEATTITHAQENYPKRAPTRLLKGRVAAFWCAVCICRTDKTCSCVAGLRSSLGIRET